jgi:hypothetical protein
MLGGKQTCILHVNSCFFLYQLRRRVIRKKIYIIRFIDKKEMAFLQKATITQVVLDNNIIDSSHDKLNLLCIRSASKMSVDLFRIRLIQ